MPSVNRENDAPKHLRPYLCHGVELSYRAHSDQAEGECFLCGKSKLYVNCNDGLSHCKSCDAKGNIYTFLLKHLHAQSLQSTSEKDYQALAEERKLLHSDTLYQWGVCKSSITGEWLIPSYNANGRLNNLYRWVLREDKKRELRSTAELHPGLMGIHLFDDKKSQVMLAEGCWDGMALWEVLGGLKAGSQGGYARTSKEADSYLADISVLAVPSCNGFDAKWGELLANKDVTFFFDSDHPRRLCPKCKKSYSVVSSPESCPTCKVKWTKKQTVITPVGFQGTQRACQILAGCPEVPKTVHYLRWGTEEEPSYNAERPSGYDVRDALTEGEEATTKIMARGENLSRIMDRVVPIPAEWVAPGAGVKEGTLTLPTKPCTTWKVLRTAFVKAMQWTPGYDATLACMLATVISVRVPKSQLWLKLQSPPSTGKTLLCNAIAVARRWIYSVDHIRGVHSGYKADKSGKQDFGLIPKIQDRTLIMKDGDTFLNIPNFEKVMSELRALYDTNTASHFLQGAGKEHLNKRTTIIIAGTDSLHLLDDSELGQRFLTINIMDGISEEMEEDICMKDMYQLDQVKGFESNGRPEEQDTKDMTEAKQLCGGYVEYLRKCAQQLLDELEPIDEPTTKQLYYMGKFIAYMRARPSKKQKESQNREMAPRLCVQIRKLAYCLAVVFNKPRVDNQVMSIVHKVTMDSSHGRTLAICRALRKYPEEGLELRSIIGITGQAKEDERYYLRFLRRIRVVELVESTSRIARDQYRMHPSFLPIYDAVMKMKVRTQ